MLKGYKQYASTQVESEYKEEETSIWHCLANLSSPSLITLHRIKGELCSAAFETQWGSSPSQQWVK